MAYPYRGPSDIPWPTKSKACIDLRQTVTAVCPIGPTFAHTSDIAPTSTTSTVTPKNLKVVCHSHMEPKIHGQPRPPGPHQTTDITTARDKRYTALIVDDLATSRMLLGEMVRQINPPVVVESFESPVSALRFATEKAVDLVITDYSMRPFDGIELTRRLRALPGYADVPIVVVTIYADRRIRHAALEAGATDFLNKPVDEQEIKARCTNLLQLRRHKLILADQARNLEREIATAVTTIHARELETLLVLAKAGEYRDECTGNHVARMAQYSSLIGTRLGLPTETVHLLEVAAPMHDIGKIGIPDSILLKTGPLSTAEMEVMRRHPRIGYDILKHSPSKYLKTGAVIALGHHERFDGEGYPEGLRADEIPIEARIVAVADVFDALVTRRPYKQAWPIERAFEHLRSQRGKHFDPACVDAFMDATPAVVKIMEYLQDNKCAIAKMSARAMAYLERC